MSQRRFATRAIQGAVVTPPPQQPLAPPLYQTSAFSFDDADLYAETLRAPGRGMVYTRYENPTTAGFEALIADLEGGAQALAAASGMAAIATVLLSLVPPGGHLVAQRELYGGTYSLLRRHLPRCGVETTMVDCADLDSLRAARRDNTAAVYVETIANPTMTVADVPAIAALADEWGVPLVVDNTVASPALCRPLEHGASIVVHSATKFLSGHSDVVGGVAVFADEGRRLAAWEHLIEFGGSMDPFAAWLLLRGIKTLDVRMSRQIANATRVAELLAAHANVQRVYWPGLRTHPTYDVGRRVLSGPGGFLSFEVDGGREAGRRFVQATRVAKLAPSLGGVESLVSHPASTTHRQYDAAALAEAGIGEGMVRMSVGIEDADDLCEDLTSALAQV